MDGQIFKFRRLSFDFVRLTIEQNRNKKTELICEYAIAFFFELIKTTIEQSNHVIIKIIINYTSVIQRHIRIFYYVGVKFTQILGSVEHYNKL